jgi:OOP family OmpA-OmpF porin
MKKISVFVLVMIVGHTLWGQQESFKDRITVGIKGGVDLANMLYSDKELKVYKHSISGRCIFGVNAELAIIHGLSFRPEFLYAGRGVKLTNQPINYKLKVNYFDMRFALVYTFLRESDLQPYVVFAPTLDFATSGNIYFRASGASQTYDKKLTKAAIAAVDIGMLVGIGAKYFIHIKDYKTFVGMELAYHPGLINTFSKQEMENQAHALNVAMYELEGTTRKNSNMEITVTLGFPLSNIKFGGGGGGMWRHRREKPAPVVQPTPQVETPVAPKAELKKECYSIREMLAYLELGEDISNKKICVFDMKFEFNKAAVKKESEKYLDEVVEMMRKFPQMIIQINGHTDNIGKDEYNQTLSEQRAKSVSDYLVRKGVKSDRLKGIGFGSLLPIDTNDTEEGRARNRRVEIEIMQIRTE